MIVWKSIEQIGHYGRIYMDYLISQWCFNGEVMTSYLTLDIEER